LATHGFFNPTQPMSSYVLMAVPEKTPPPEDTDKDGKLEAWELMSDPRLRLKADLVVLSACETGLGATVRGEGLTGLTRALQVAGARSIVASQWEVNDRSTADLMVAFHQRLGDTQRKLRKDEALQQAMKEIARTWPDPYYWAPFV